MSQVRGSSPRSSTKYRGVVSMVKRSSPKAKLPVRIGPPLPFAIKSKSTGNVDFPVCVARCFFHNSEGRFLLTCFVTCFVTCLQTCCRDAKQAVAKVYRFRYTFDMSYYDGIYEYAADNYGLITSAEAKAIGVPNVELVKLAHRGRLTRNNSRNRQAVLRQYLRILP